VVDPFWSIVPKSRKAPKQVRRALDAGAELIFAWGGDGMVQRCVDVVAGTEAALAIVPAGTANLLASNLGIPKDVEAAVEVGLSGERLKLDVGRVNGEGFAVMAGAGFDARMIADADGRLKERLGRAAYLVSGAKNLRARPFGARIKVDGTEWFRGEASCILLGNVGKLFGGVEVFAEARPDDGRLALGVVTADGVVQWLRTLARAALGTASESPYARTTTARIVRIKLDRKVRYQLDGGERTKVKSLRIVVEPGAVEVCVPRAPDAASAG
jgi:diacylglycerol kinase (ATP)